MNAEKTSQAVRCTCPNCQVKFTASALEAFDAHVSTCERKGNHEFPKYMVKVSESKSGFSRRSFQDMSQAAAHFTSGSSQVEIGRRVLEDDYSLRPIVDAERHLISEIADMIEASK
jgi:hypothetical protein